MQEKQLALIKIGGRAFEDAAGFHELAEGILANPQAEIIIVHGGGAEVSQALKAAGRSTRFIDGIRVTNKDDMRIVEGILSDTVNPRIVSWLSQHGVKCRGLSGKTRGLFIVEPLQLKGQSPGFVGRICQVDQTVVHEYLKQGIVPVISPISADAGGESYNVNADSAAAALAAAMGCTDLIFLTDVSGVHAGGDLCDCLSIEESKRLIDSGEITGGMVAKMSSAFEALANGVSRVHVTQWRGPQTIGDVLGSRCTYGTIVRRGSPGV
jgi:acetylglutamate kinase